MNASAAFISDQKNVAKSGIASSRCLVVMYHYVHDRFNGADRVHPTGRGVRSISIADFESQLDCLSRRLEPTDWTQLDEHLEGRKSLPPQTFLLTFDDGLREHAEIVAPILERRGLRGLFFIPGSTLSGDHMLTAHCIHLLLEELGESRLEATLNESLSDASTANSLSGEDDAQARRIYHYESPSTARLKYLINMKLPLEVRAAVVIRLFESHLGPQTDWSQRWYMDADLVRALNARGHAIGGHSFAHEPYGRLKESVLASDARQCCSALRSILGPGSRPFAYPFGSVQPAAASCLENAGFSAAFGTTSHWLDPSAARFNLPRVDTIHVGVTLENDAE